MNSRQFLRITFLNRAACSGVVIQQPQNTRWDSQSVLISGPRVGTCRHPLKSIFCFFGHLNLTEQLVFYVQYICDYIGQAKKSNTCGNTKLQNAKMLINFNHHICERTKYVCLIRGWKSQYFQRSKNLHLAYLLALYYVHTNSPF